MRHLELQNSQYYEFGPFRLTTGDHRLYRNGEVVLLPPKEFDLLLLLAQNPGRVMSRENLIKALWPNTVVEEANLNVHISALRKALAETAGEQHFIETLPRLGYRFIAPVTEVNMAAAISSISHALAENGVGVSNLNAVTAVHNHAAADWRSRRRWATIMLWLLAIGLFGVSAFLYFKPVRSTGA